MPDPSVASFGGRVGALMSAGRRIREAAEKFESLTADEIVYFRQERQKYLTENRKLNEIMFFLDDQTTRKQTGQPAVTFKEWRALQAARVVGLSDEDARRVAILREVQRGG